MKKIKEIENIFSKKEEKKELANIRVPIILDTREKQSMVAANLIEKNAQIKFEKLEIGDYLIGDTIIERKTFQDFQSSILDKRLVFQLTEMKKYPKAALLIEGFYYNYTDSTIHENAIRGMFLSAILDFEIPLIFTEDEKDTAQTLIVLARRYDRNKKEFSIRQKKSEMSFEERKQFVLEGFPGIGPASSKKLLEKYKTLKEVFSQPKEKLAEIDSIDMKKAEEFRKILER